MSVVVHPDDRGADIAVGHRGYRARIVDPIERRNPEIEHAVDGRAEGNPRAVRADPHDASFGICENQASAKQAGVHRLGRFVEHDPDPPVKRQDCWATAKHGQSGSGGFAGECRSYRQTPFH
jgi:hypothetical protein